MSLLLIYTIHWAESKKSVLKFFPDLELWSQSTIWFDKRHGDGTQSDQSSVNLIEEIQLNFPIKHEKGKYF